MSPDDDLRPPATDAEWLAYHAIRRRVLFELRGRGGDFAAAETAVPDASTVFMTRAITDER